MARGVTICASTAIEYPTAVRASFALVLALVLSAGCSGQQVLNTLTPSSGYAFASAVVYDPAHRLTLDIYTPQDARRAPVVVFFYGGRWQEGTPADYRFVGQALASQGFVAVLPDYRHYPQVKFPEFVLDAAQAVRWTLQQVARYGGDPAQVFVMGHSSGAHLAAMVALNPEYLGADRARLKGMIGLAGPYDFLPLTAPDLRDMFGPPERFALSQPIAYVDADAPPLLLLHGANDETVGAHNTRNLAAAVNRAGGFAETVIYEKLDHPWAVAVLAAPLRRRADVLERVARFVRERAGGRPGGIVGIGTESRE